MESISFVFQKQAYHFGVVNVADTSSVCCSEALSTLTKMKHQKLKGVQIKDFLTTLKSHPQND